MLNTYIYLYIFLGNLEEIKRPKVCTLPKESVRRVCIPVGRVPRLLRRSDFLQIPHAAFQARDETPAAFLTAASPYLSFRFPDWLSSECIWCMAWNTAAGPLQCADRAIYPRPTAHSRRRRCTDGSWWRTHRGPVLSWDHPEKLELWSCTAPDRHRRSEGSVQYKLSDFRHTLSILLGTGLFHQPSSVLQVLSVNSPESYMIKRVPGSSNTSEKNSAASSPQSKPSVRSWQCSLKNSKLDASSFHKNSQAAL